MGLASANIFLRNALSPTSHELEVRAFADPEMTYLCLPPRLVQQLRLERRDVRVLRLIDGSVKTCPYVGPVRVRFGDNPCFVGALEHGDEVLLGTIPMTDMDVTIDPQRNTLVTNPPPAIVARDRVECAADNS